MPLIIIGQSNPQLTLSALNQRMIVNQLPFLVYTLRDGFFYRLIQLCVLVSSAKQLWMNEEHSSSYGEHIGMHKLCSIFKDFY